MTLLICILMLGVAAGLLWSFCDYWDNYKERQDDEDIDQYLCEADGWESYKVGVVANHDEVPAPLRRVRTRGDD